MKKIIYSILTLLCISQSCSNSDKTVKTKDSYEYVVFPDGSEAFINKNSSIMFDENFDERIVVQSGEVFYNVAKGDSEFEIITDLGDIKVHGTSFNVDAKEDNLSVEVEEGTVELLVNNTSETLKRGEKAVVSSLKKGIAFGKAELEHKKWIKKLNKEMKHLGREIKENSQSLVNDIKEDSKDLQKESKRFGKEMKNQFKD